jgi:hypothetical protein
MLRVVNLQFRFYKSVDHKPDYHEFCLFQYNDPMRGIWFRFGHRDSTGWRDAKRELCEAPDEWAYCDGYFDPIFSPSPDSPAER